MTFLLLPCPLIVLLPLLQSNKIPSTFFRHETHVFSKTAVPISLGRKQNHKNNNVHKCWQKYSHIHEQFSRKSTKTTLKKHPPCAPTGTAPEGGGRGRSPMACSKALEKCCLHMRSSKLEGPFKACNCLFKKSASRSSSVAMLCCFWLFQSGLLGSRPDINPGF